VADSPGQIAQAYFAAWQAKDFAAYQSVLADDVVFDGPLGHVEGAAACRQGIERMSAMVTGIDVKKRFVDGPDVLTWFDLRTSVAPPCPTANWCHVEDGKIIRIRVAFDPRPLVS
jgi:ketosteroid isomerase-like protein